MIRKLLDAIGYQDEGVGVFIVDVVLAAVLLIVLWVVVSTLFAVAA
jgi:hypothetical protein